MSDQVAGHNTAPLAQIIAARHLVMANLNKTPADPRNYTAAQGEARVTREEHNLENVAQPRQASEQPSSSSSRWEVYHDPSPAADPADTQRRHEAWRDNSIRHREANSSSEWSWDHQNWTWEQPTWAKVYASQSTWDEPYPNIPRHPARQVVEEAGKERNRNDV